MSSTLKVKVFLPEELEFVGGVNYGKQRPKLVRKFASSSKIDFSEE